MDMKIETDINEITSIISSQLAPTIDNLLKTNVLNYYATMTEDEKKKKLIQYRQKFAEYKEILKNDISVKKYLQAYEFILEFRKFILGTLGDINYSFVISYKSAKSNSEVQLKTITLGKLNFLQLLKDKNGNIIGLKQDAGRLRFTTSFLQNLRKIIKEIEQKGMSIEINSSCSSFSLVNDDLGARENFDNGKIFKARIDFLQRLYKIQKFYQFQLSITKDITATNGKKVVEFYIKKVNGNPDSSTVFSALGKYFSDEMTAKRQALREANINSIDPKYPNAGNLTEMYILAKNRLNQGKNHFHPRKQIPGMTLFQLWNEVKSNRQPFYSGGDILMNQVKSFLGENPTLTTYNTIRNTINNFYNALNKNSIVEIKNELNKLLLQDSNNSKLITAEEKELSQAIAQSFTEFFKDLTK